ncbi:TRAM domain protein [uncultured archaeon]|nr:TRAM domain protein [uncultured archaeon]
MGFGRGNFSDMPKPVKVGDELDVTIEAVAAKGDGIAKKEGFVIFVPGATQGETCKIRVTQVKASSAVAEKI